MTGRVQLADAVSGQVGTLSGQGFDGPNPYSEQLGRPAEAWCGDFVTAMFARAGLALPSMQPGCRTGFAYVPDAVAYARAKQVTRWSWQADPGDVVCFDWNGDGLADHCEIVTSVYAGGIATVGGNSGPGGGVNGHTWATAAPAGNRLILLAINAAGIVDFTAPAGGAPRGAQPGSGSGLLMLKTPMMRGAQVAAVQRALNAHGAQLGVDGYFGPLTRDAVLAFQRAQHLTVDGIVGPQTRGALGL